MAARPGDSLTGSKFGVSLEFVSEGLQTTLRAHGLQVTAQRLAVLRAARERPHATANELIDDVRDAIGSVSRQSVYDTLNSFSERGILRRIQPAGSLARYESRVGDNHHHLVCRRCDRMVDVDCAVGDTPCLTPDDGMDFLIDEAEVIYWGVCPECRSSDATDRPQFAPALTTPPHRSRQEIEEHQ
mgnify:CR=1 FL=1